MLMALPQKHFADISMNLTNNTSAAGSLLGLAMSATLLMTVSTTRAEDAAPATGSVPVPAPIEGKGYHLVKNWDFRSTVTTPEKLREEFFTRFVYNDGTMDHFNDEWERYGENKNHVFGTQGLNLVARVVADELKNGGIESGMLRSTWSGKYGYYECSMKVPRGRGLWPAFWLYPADGKGPAEIDVVEIVNNGKDTTHTSFHFVHTTKTGKKTPITSQLNKWGRYDSPIDYADDFHTFAVEWTPDVVTHYVDGQVIVSRNFDWLASSGGEAGPTTVLLNLAVGGKWPQPPQSKSDFPAELAVKYIRVWQKEGAPAK